MMDLLEDERILTVCLAVLIQYRILTVRWIQHIYTTLCNCAWHCVGKTLAVMAVDLRQMAALQHLVLVVLPYYLVSDSH